MAKGLLDLAAILEKKAKAIDEAASKLAVDTVLKGWKNVRGEDGKPLEFTKAAAVKLFTDLPEVYERLQEEAKLSANFRDAALEEEVKN